MVGPKWHSIEGWVCTKSKRRLGLAKCPCSVLAATGLPENLGQPLWAHGETLIPSLFFWGGLLFVAPFFPAGVHFGDTEGPVRLGISQPGSWVQGCKLLGRKGNPTWSPVQKDRI
jgi:hypothetical protein